MYESMVVAKLWPWRNHDFPIDPLRGLESLPGRGGGGGGGGGAGGWWGWWGLAFSLAGEVALVAEVELA